jgi:ArsR family transcriptional regulator, arsenate/arsenite/antimonite-responsive transcriptional repressor
VQVAGWRRDAALAPGISDPRCAAEKRRLAAGATVAWIGLGVDILPYFWKYRNMVKSSRGSVEQIAQFADMFSAMGTEARLRIMQLLLTAHPEGLVVSEIQEELGIPHSTLSHHLDKLKAEDLVCVRRESTFLRYTANTDALRELLQFLYAECCTRNKAVKPRSIVQICG